MNKRFSTFFELKNAFFFQKKKGENASSQTLKMGFPKFSPKFSKFSEIFKIF